MDNGVAQVGKVRNLYSSVLWDSTWVISTPPPPPTDLVT